MSRAATLIARSRGTTIALVAAALAAAGLITGVLITSEAQAHAASGFTIVTSTVSVNSEESTITGNAICPAGDQELGGGFTINGPASTAMEDYPASATTWTVKVLALAGAFTVGNSLSVSVTCET